MYNLPSSRTACLAFGLTLFALSGCGGDNPTGPTAGGVAPLVFSNFQAAAIVIGQLDMSSDEVDAGTGEVGAVGLREPRGAISAGSLYLVDSLNNRVLGYNSLPAVDGQAADFVLGQDDFTTRQEGTTANTFFIPVNAVVSRGKLFVADGLNHRILIWNRLPKSNVPADVVVGQPDFTTNDFSGQASAGSFKPAQVAVSGNKLLVSDFFHNRVLIWNSIPTTNGVPADVVVGQTDFTSRVRGLSASSLSSPGGIWVGRSKLVIVDGGNNRVLIYNTIPTSNGLAANIVVGTPDFDTAGSGTPSASTFRGVGSVVSDGTSLFVADPGARRILIFDFPTANGAEASGILGQSNFTFAAFDDSDQDGNVGPSASSRTFQGPGGMTIIGNNLVVTDSGNSRLLVFEGQ